MKVGRLLHLRWFADEGEEDTSQEQAAESDDSGDDRIDEAGRDRQAEEIKAQAAEEAVDVEGLDADELKAYVNTLQSKNKSLGDQVAKFESISRDRLHEIMEKKNQIKELRIAEEARAKKEAEERGEYEKLYRETQPKLDLLTQDFAETQEFFESEYQAALVELPEDWHPLIPEGLDIRQRIKMVRNLTKKALASRAPQSNGTPKPAPGVGASAPKPPTGESGEGSGNTGVTYAQVQQELREAGSSSELEAIIEKYRGVLR